MTRKARQLKILEIIKEFDINTQSALAKKLRESGEKVTQATVSRDIKELGLTKIVTKNGVHKYVRRDTDNNVISPNIRNMYRDSVLSIASSMNIIVIKTISGSANVAALLIDKLSLDEVIGSVAGDDTLLIVVRKESEVQYVMNKLMEISK